jgi:L-asparagine transporter-like permease
MLEQFFAFIMLMIFTMFTYIGIHMSFEKDSKKHIPLLWEPGGLFYNQFDKSDIKYRDGDNT